MTCDSGRSINFRNLLFAVTSLPMSFGMKGVTVRGEGVLPLYIAPAFQYLEPNNASHCLIVLENPISSF
ncbi:hypothetical protein HanPSC8_Chr14g0623511 [Helianthus annuus]|nr:hypothetical protein HanPSC8_Chr14g0623511 [Helianthus annuus]